MMWLLSDSREEAKADNGYGIIVVQGAGYNIYNNSVHLNTNQTATTGLPAAFNVGSSVTATGAVNVRTHLREHPDRRNRALRDLQ